MLCSSVLDVIGGTPLVALDRLAAGLPARVLVKLEYGGPGASIKDRVAARMIEDAEARGLLQPGGYVVELTSGNMGIGLAVACAVKGYRLIAVMSAGNSEERRRCLRALGAEVEVVPQAGGSRPGQVTREDIELVERRTAELVEALGAFRPDQFTNANNAFEHETSTGPEIWEQSGGKIDYFCAAVGTGGTFVGVARALKQRSTAVKTFAVEPEVAPVLSGRPVTSTRHKIQGTSYAMVPPAWDPSLCDGFLTVSDDEVIATTRALAAREAILGGFSTGANVAAALQLARNAQPGEVVATIAPDTGLKYLSTDLYP